jgi:hypothetical protein
VIAWVLDFIATVFWFAVIDTVSDRADEFTRLARAASRGIAWNPDDVGAVLLASDPLGIVPGSHVRGSYLRAAQQLVDACPMAEPCTSEQIGRALSGVRRRCRTKASS